MAFPRPRTVRAKLTLTTTLVVGLVLVAMGFLIDLGTGKTLNDTIDGELRRRGGEFARGMEGRGDGPGRHGWGRDREVRPPFAARPDSGPGANPDPNPNIGSEPEPEPPNDGAERQGGRQVVRGGASETNLPPGVNPPFERGPFGRRPGDQDDMRPHFVPFDPNWGGPREAAYDPGVQAAIQAKGGDATTTVLWKGERRRVYSVAVRRDGKVVGMVQVSYPLGDVEGALAGLRRLLVTVAIPLGMLLGALASLFIVDRLLRPLRLITANAQTIGGGTLEERLPVVGDDEFAGLATTLNRMLGRLEEAFRLEQATTRRLAEAVEQQRRFTADASHELKTPLSTIKAHAGLLGGLEDDDDRESVEAIGEAANRMRGLVDDLLVLARADGGSLTARTAPVDLTDAVGAAVGAVSPLAVEVRGAPRPLVVQGNGEALTRLFINLLDNAKKYAGTGEPVEVRLGRRGDAAEIAVVDRGVGIAPEHLPRLFDRFYRPDESRTSETGGTGLGLAICKEIAAAHGGTIEVASRVGGGTAFTVTLPLAS